MMFIKWLMWILGGLGIAFSLLAFDSKDVNLQATVGLTASTAIFDVTNPQHTFIGFGSSAISKDSFSDETRKAAVQNLYQLPSFVYGRMDHRTSCCIPEGLDFAGYLAVWKQRGPAEPIDLQLPNGQYTPYKHIFLPQVPLTFREQDQNGCSYFKSGSVVDFATYLAAGVAHFNIIYGTLCHDESDPNHCAKADYIEIANEPDGVCWGYHINEQDYKAILSNLYNILQTYSIDTRIIGPGTSHVDWDNGIGTGTGKKSWETDSWVKEIIKTNDQYGNVAHKVGAWSVHDWIYAKTSSTERNYPKNTFYEDIESTAIIDGMGQTAVRYFFPKWYDTPKKENPNSEMIVGEWGTGATKYHGISYLPSNNQYQCLNPAVNTLDCSRIHSVPYGVRVYILGISALASGANATLYWEAMESQSNTSDAGGLGLLNYQGQKKTIYYALEPLFTHIPLGAKIVNATTEQAGDDIYSVGFIYPENNETCVTMAMANGALGPKTRITELTNIGTKTLSSVTGILFQPGQNVFIPQSTVIDNDFIKLTQSGSGYKTGTIEMPQDSLLTFKACFK